MVLKDGNGVGKLDPTTYRRYVVSSPGGIETLDFEPWRLELVHNGFSYWVDENTKRAVKAFWCEGAESLSKDIISVALNIEHQRLRDQLDSDPDSKGELLVVIPQLVNDISDISMIGGPKMLIEWLKGDFLEQKREELSANKIGGLFSSLALELAFLHDRGIFNGAINYNCLRLIEGEEDHLQIVDFSGLWLFNQKGAAYVAPELLRGGAVSNYGIDIYSFFSCLYTTLAGRDYLSTFYGKDGADNLDLGLILADFRDGSIEVPDIEGISDQLMALLRKGLGYADQRFHNMWDVFHELDDLWKNGEVEAKSLLGEIENHVVNKVEAVLALSNDLYRLISESQPDFSLDDHNGRLMKSLVIRYFGEEVFEEYFGDMENLTFINGTELSILGGDPNAQYIYKFNLHSRFAKRIIRERNILSLLGGYTDGVPKVGGFLFQEQELIGYEVEFLNGCTLRDVLESREKIREDILLDVVIQVLDVLEVAHRFGVFHRDIKPANIFLTLEAGKVKAKLIDFGCAYRHDALGRITPSNSILGTFCYMPPEQLSGDMVDGRADIYSLAISIYEMLVGHVPVVMHPHANIGSVRDIMRSIILLKDYLVLYDKKISEGLYFILKKATAANLEDRYQSAEEMKMDLIAYCDQLKKTHLG